MNREQILDAVITQGIRPGRIPDLTDRDYDEVMDVAEGTANEEVKNRILTRIRQERGFSSFYAECCVYCQDIRRLRRSRWPWPLMAWNPALRKDPILAARWRRSEERRRLNQAVERSKIQKGAFSGAALALAATALLAFVVLPQLLPAPSSGPSTEPQYRGDGGPDSGSQASLSDAVNLMVEDPAAAIEYIKSAREASPADPVPRILLEAALKAAIASTKTHPDDKKAYEAELKALQEEGP